MPNTLLGQARDIYLASAPLRTSALAGAAFAVSAVGLAALARLALGDAFKGVPFVTFFPAFIATGFFCGWRAGAAAAAMGGVLGWLFWMEPAQGPSALFGVGFYTFAVAVILLLTASAHRGFSEYESMMEARRALNEELERRVAARTYELEAVNRRLREEIEQRAAAEAQLRQFQKMEALGRLTGGVAHDFNNMLAVIIGSLGMAKRALPADPDKASRQIDHAMAGARRAADLTAQLLAFSRKTPIKSEIAAPRQIVNAMLEWLPRTLGERVRLETRFEAEESFVHADIAQLESAILNLCLNGRDAMPEGGRLVIAVENEAQAVRILVQDEGMGMAQETIDRAFDPFFSTKPMGGGAGLGLAQVYRFAQNAGGSVEIKSSLGKGTQVAILLPRRPPPDATPEAEEEKPSEARAGDRVVLVVEDDPGVRRMSSAALRDLGYTVLETDAAQAALAVLDGTPRVDLLFTDVVMPGVSGPELAQEARKRRPDLRVLFTSGYLGEANAIDPELLLKKPYTMEELARSVRRLLG